MPSGTSVDDVAPCAGDGAAGAEGPVADGSSDADTMGTAEGSTEGAEVAGTECGAGGGKEDAMGNGGDEGGAAVSAIRGASMATPPLVTAGFSGASCARDEASSAIAVR